MTERATAGLTRVVLGRVDPLLQALLPLVVSYQQYVERNDSDSALLIQLIQSQMKILENLQQLILQLGPPFAPTLIVLAEYVSLPLNAIFHIPALPSTTTTSADEEVLRRSRIQLSHIRKLHRATAATIKSYVQTSCSHEEKDEALRVRLSDSHLVKFLVSLTNALPSSAFLLEKSSSLDEGTETWLALLDAETEILRVCSGDAVYNQWDGNLIAQIADCVTSMALSDNLKLSLESLATLESLLLKVRKPHFWQSIFPGVFASLYRRFVTINRQTPSGLSVSIETQCLHLMQELMTAALENLNTPQLHQAERPVLEMLKCLAIESSSNRSHKAAEDKTEESSFLQELKTRMVSPLSFVLRQSAVSGSDKVKVQVVLLCRMLLKDTAACWTSTTLPELAFDICLVLKSDADGIVANHASETISEIQQCEPGSGALSWMIPRLQSLAEQTVVLAKGAKTIQVQTQLQLLRGYISTVGSAVPAALATSTQMQKSLIELSDIDFDSANSKGPAIVTAQPYEESPLQFRFLTGENALLGRKMLRDLGAALGPKHGAVVVDRLISDFYEASLQHLTSFGEFQEAFLHQWIGSIVVAKEILRGGFFENIESSPKEKKRRHRFLESLSSSVLPLLVDSSLWSIRTKDVSHELEAMENGGYAPRRRLTTKQLSSNACVMNLLLSLVSSFILLLGERVSKFRQMMLLPLVEKATTTNHELVKNAAEQSLAALAKESALSSTTVLVSQYFNQLVSAMFGRLRLPGGMMVPVDGDLLDTLSLVTSITWVLRVVASVHSQETCGADKMGTKGLIDLISLLDDRFDHLALRKLLSEENTYIFLGVHQLCFEFLHKAIGANDGSVYSYPSERGCSKSKPWLDLLSNFRKPGVSSFSQPAAEEADVGREHQTSLHIDLGEIEFVSKLITKDCFLLSNNSLMVQVSACQSLTSGYRLLAFVSCNYEDPEDEQSTIKNSILRQAATSWPSIKARLHNVTEEVIGSERVDVSLILRATTSRGRHPEDVAKKRFFLSQILTLIATICECGGEFMAARFRDDVWPVLARFLERILKKEINVESKKIVLIGIQDEGSEEVQPTCKLTDSERHLMHAIFECLGRVICILDLPERTLAAIASTLLPFLDTSYYGKDIGERSMETLKKLARKNCDVLCRPLLQLSGRGIPKFPIISKKDKLLSPQVSNKPKLLQLETKANELLSYIEALPEQTLD